MSLEERLGVAREYEDQPGKARPAVGSLLRRAYQRNVAIWQAECPDPGFTSVQSAALRAVQDLGPCSLTVIGRAAAMDPATTRGVVDRLVLRRLVALQADPADRRKVIVGIERAGRDRLRTMAPVLNRISERTVAALNPAERVALEYLLSKLLAEEPGEEGARAGRAPSGPPSDEAVTAEDSRRVRRGRRPRAEPIS